MPSFASIGDLLGKLVFDVQKAAGDTYITDHVPLSQRVVTDPEAIKCSILMNSLMGEALIRYVPAYAGTITDSPSTGTDVEVLAPDGKVLQGTGAGAGNGVDLPVPSVLMQIDATTGGFIDLWWKFSDEHTTDWVSIGARIDPYPGPMTIIGQDFDGGSDLRYAKGPHSHPSPTAAQVSTELFYAKITGPDYGGALICAVNLNSAVSSDVGWSIIPSQPGVYERPIVGALTAADLDGLTPVITNNGCDLVGAKVMGYEFPPQSPPLEYSTPRFGPYTIEDIGEHREIRHAVDGAAYYVPVQTHARIRRMPGFITGSAFVEGLTFYVGSGNVYGNKYFTFNSSPPVYLEDGGTEQAWLVSSSAPSGIDPTYALCTRPQLNALAATATYIASATGTDNELLQLFSTLVGTPGVTCSLDDLSPWLFDFESAQLDAYPANGVVKLMVQILRSGVGGDAVLFEALSSPIYTIMPTPISFTWTGSGQISSSDKLLAKVFLSSTCTDPVTIHVKVGGPNFGSKITVPFQMSVTGVATGAHDQLDHRNFPKQHPNCSTHPVLSTSSVGWLWLGNGPANDRGVFDRSDYVRVTLQGDTYGDGVYGIKPTWQDGTAIPDGFLVGVYIANATPSTPKKAVSGATPPTGSGYLPLANDALPNGTGKQHTFNGPTELVYRLDLTEQRWRLVSFQTYAVVTP